ncbi:MAG: hypothetical protein R3B93_25295 [Bacteroidia bacterium]
MKIKLSIPNQLLLFILTLVFLSCEKQEIAKYHESIMIEGQLLIDCNKPYANRKVSIFQNYYDGDLFSDGHPEKELFSTMTDENGYFVFPEVTTDHGYIQAIRWWTDTIPIVDKGLVNLHSAVDFSISNPNPDVNIGTMHITQGSGDIDVLAKIYHQIPAGTHCQLIFIKAAYRVVNFTADGSYPLIVQVDSLGWNKIDCTKGFPCTYMLEGKFNADINPPGIEKEFIIELGSPCPDNVLEFILE